MKLDIRLKFILFSFAFLFLPLFSAGGNIGAATTSGAYVRAIPIIVIFLVCFFMLSWYITKNYLTPLKKLLDAVKTIADGNLDFEIGYSGKNEMGTLCTAFELMGKSLKVSLEKQNELENSRKELIASISHDLRTPLSSIKGYVEGLPKAVNDPDKLNRYICVIKNKTDTLDNMIERLFEYSQLDIDERREALCVYDSADLLETVIYPIEIEFSDQPICLEVIRPFPSVRLNANEDTIAQVFDNIISNAKRYVGENGKITIETTIEVGYLKVSVTDNGPGILPEDLPHVFDQFYRAEKSRSRIFGGAGLGLAICKKIVEQHGGGIWVESEESKKTKFSFSLPIV